MLRDGLCAQRHTRRSPHARANRTVSSKLARQAADAVVTVQSLVTLPTEGWRASLNPVVAACERGARRGASCAQQRARSAHPRRRVEHAVRSTPPTKTATRAHKLAPRSAAQTEGAAHQASSRQHQAAVTARVGRCSAGAPRCAAETRQRASARPSVTTAARRAPSAARAAPGQDVAPSGPACGERGAATRLQRAGRKNRPAWGCKRPHLRRDKVTSSECRTRKAPSHRRSRRVTVDPARRRRGLRQALARSRALGVRQCRLSCKHLVTHAACRNAALHLKRRDARGASQPPLRAAGHKPCAHRKVQICLATEQRTPPRAAARLERVMTALRNAANTATAQNTRQRRRKRQRQSPPRGNVRGFGPARPLLRCKPSALFCVIEISKCVCPVHSACLRVADSRPQISLSRC